MRNKITNVYIYIYDLSIFLATQGNQIYDESGNFSSFYFFLTSGDWKTFKITSFSNFLIFNF